VPYVRQSDYAVRNPWKYGYRKLLDYLLVYVQEGECRFHVDGTDYPLTSGDFCLIQPGSLNRLEGMTETITPYAHMDLFYNPDREESFPTLVGQTDLTPYAYLLQPRLNDLPGVDIPVKLKPRNPIDFRDKMLQMIASWLGQDPLGPLKAQHYATELALMILEDHMEQRALETNALPPLNWITSFFSFHITEPLTVEMMAERAHLSPSRFNDVFKSRFGMPPHKYLRQLRIHHARELLATTTYDQAQVAAYCGFADVHHFSKAFKRQTGLSPGEYRKKAAMES
jgi:AraC-like DNA-binding protein